MRSNGTVGGFMRYSKIVDVWRISFLLCCLLSPISIPSSNADEAPSKKNYTIETAQIAEVLKTEDAGFKFISYVVSWKNHRVVVSDPIADTDYKVGDTIKFMAHRQDLAETNATDRKILNFIILPSRPHVTEK
jgi:hypothetical protein